MQGGTRAREHEVAATCAWFSRTALVGFFGPPFRGDGRGA
ncbi:hypothetical protein MNBD_ACTINO01-252 [hydrothermal vent metagenome]|uniref:Uncharacterized protein n=1 Tax=hydrothermal vent metagenome TaxID=652676 RepID=A0A3B0SWI4_9ZZZZ